MPHDQELLHRSRPSALALRELALVYALGVLLLVLVTVAIGGTGLYLWQQASRESVRIDSLVEETQGMRGSLYRQMKEVFDALFLDDRDAGAQYRTHQREVEARLDALTALAATTAEHEAVLRLARAYAAIRSHTDALMEHWPHYSLAERRALLEGELERGSLQSYEAAFGEIENQLMLRQVALQKRRAALVWISALLLSLPILGAVALLLTSPWVLRRAIIEPLYSVQQATAMISRGQLDHRVPQVGARELQSLAQSVNRMAQELAESRASLVRAEKQATLAALVPVVAHNIRNPLASIRAMAQVMQDNASPSELRNGLQDIIATSDRLEGWTHSLLSYLNPLEPQRVPCTSEALADNVQTMLQGKPALRDVRLDFTGWRRDLRLNIDAHLVEQALYALILNAVEATPAGGSVRVTITASDGGIVLEIEDEGCGIPFNPDPRDLKPGPSTKRHGTGLGIPFAVKVFDVHGAAVRFDTSGGKGTRVTILMPAQ
jgi:signal transduction histidine kinase